MSSTNEPRLKRLYQLDGLRFPMICMIVLSHFDFMIWYSYGQFFWDYLINPVLAVDFFFMLSGFGLFIYMEKNELNYSASPSGLFLFAQDKIKKIYPPYFFSMLISIPFTIYDKSWRHSISYAVIWTVILFIICMTLLQSASGIGVISHGINGIGWFLSSLYICYLAFPICHKLMKKLRSRISLIISVFACGGMILLIFILFKNVEFKLSNYLRGYIDDLSYGSPYFRVFFVIMGAILAKIYLSSEKDSHRIMVVLEPIVLILSIAYCIFRNTLSQTLPVELLRAVDILLCTAVIYVFSFGKGHISKLLSSPVLVRLGDLSMYIFLFHYPIRMLIDLYFSRHLMMFGDMTGIVEAIVIIVLTMILILIYKRFIVRLFIKLKSAG